MTLHELPHADSSWATLSERFQSLARQAVATRGECAVSLAGGRTPGPLYQGLNKRELPWKQMWWFLGDERWVEKGNPLSNETLVTATLGVDRPEFKYTFLSWYTAGQPDLAAKLYQEKMLGILGEPPVLDLSLLGLGEDGHTASLFPGTTALEETKQFAVANQVPQVSQAPVRLTLTYPVFNQAREVWFLLTGGDKAAMVERLLQRDLTIPSARIENSNQHIYWLK